MRWLQPNLEEVRRLIWGRIELAVSHAGARAHDLDLSGTKLPLVAHAILVRQRSGDYVAENFHVSVRVRREAAACCDVVFVDDTQRSKPHGFGIVIISEREGMSGVEPTEVRVASAGGFVERKHSASLDAASEALNGEGNVQLACERGEEG